MIQSLGRDIKILWLTILFGIINGIIILNDAPKEQIELNLQMMILEFLQSQGLITKQIKKLLLQV